MRNNNKNDLPRGELYAPCSPIKFRFDDTFLSTHPICDYGNNEGKHLSGHWNMPSRAQILL